MRFSPLCVYWNVSTWNPYQALLVKTQLRASQFQ